MNNYSVTFSILGYYFKIITHNERLLDEQKKHIKKFCIAEQEETNVRRKTTATIQYVEDMSFFRMLRKKFDTRKTEIVQSFEGIFHLKYEEDGRQYFCQLGNEWILIKNDDESYVVVGDGATKTTKYPFRLVREIVVRKQEEAGKLFMHATGMVVDGKGIAILGNKQSGKTTFFTKVLDAHDAEVISNDRVFFYRNNSVFKMDYFPIPVVYRFGTVANSKGLNKHILEADYCSENDGFWNSDDALPLPLTDLPMMFDGVFLRETGNLNLLLFTKFHIDWNEEYICKKLTPLEVIPQLMETCFTPIDYESKRKEWAYFRKVPTTELEFNANAVITDIASNVDSYFIEFGKKANVTKILADIMGGKVTKNGQD